MRFSIHVICGPYSQQGNLSALLFCKAALASKHSIYRVFFSGEGVLSGTRLGVPPQDEIDLYTEWESLARDHNIELILCISAALRRGIINDQEASRYRKNNHNTSPHFILSGLGQLVEAGLESDRLVTFGSH